MKQSFYIYIDGKYRSVAKETIDALTPGRFKAKGVFETIRVAEGRIEFLNEHLNRLFKGLKILKIRHSLTAPKLKRITQTIAKKSRDSADFLRLRILVWKEKTHVHCAVMALPYQPPTELQYQKGLKVCLVKTGHQAGKLKSDLKSLDYGMFADALLEAQSHGFDDALMINAKGHVFETTRANIFISYQGCWMTPPLSSGCLNGIIRQEVFKMAAKLKIPIVEANITPQMVKAADSAFITNSLMGLIPIF